ncbi:MAG: lipid-A-disaccharide synthase [Holophagales bacterium]|jgi:lipid-A-disaccharide synthase|nr:lipid-A-disaccharide synthase [Holophagales bacterium]
MTTVLVVAGEASGDLHGAEILSALKRLCPSLCVVGVGGAKMSPFLDKKLADASDLGVVGFFEVLRHLPKILKLERAILRAAESEDASMALLIDYQSFNLRLAKALRKKKPSMRLHQYVCPQVWAWKEGRVPILGKTFDALYCLFDFEPRLFDGLPIEAVCLGHPLVDLVAPEMERDAFFRESGLSPDVPLVALLPGSRQSETSRLLPPMLGLVKMWPYLGRQPVQWAIPAAPTLNADKLRAAVGAMPIAVLENKSYATRAYASAALVCSGTATLETAILGTPFAILYRMNPLTLFLARRLVKIKQFGLANVVAGREVAKELLQDEVTPQGLADELNRLLDPKTSNETRESLKQFRAKLGEPGAAERVAKHMMLCGGARPE